jgi:hypothetical protein
MGKKEKVGVKTRCPKTTGRTGLLKDEARDTDAGLTL